MNSLVTALIHQMASRAGITATAEHLRILEYAYDYYERNKVGPLTPNIERHTGATRADLKRLFPAGLQSVYVWVGIPIQTPHSSCKKMATIEVDDPREVYLDHNATTYLRDEVLSVLGKRFSRPMAFGNPGSSSNLGKDAYDGVQKARQQIASCLDVSSDEIVFTGCGSGANNLAIKGVAFQHLRKPGHLITSNTEHSAVLETLGYLESLGFRVTFLPVDSDGRLSPGAVAEALREDTVLVSVMAVNNEIGTINPIHEIGELCRDAGVPLFVDAIQGFGKIPLRPKEHGITMLSISGHKIYAPKGVAALYVDRDQALTPLIHGGGQEGGRRAGTENVDAIVAFGLAAKLADAEREAEHDRLLQLRDNFLSRLLEIDPRIVVNGSLSNRVPNNLNVGFPDVDSGSLLLSLNQIGVYVSSGSACHAGGVESSHVIKALGVDTERYGTIRFSFGLRTEMADVDYVMKHLPTILDKLNTHQPAAG